MVSPWCGYGGVSPEQLNVFSHWWFFRQLRELNIFSHSFSPVWDEKAERFLTVRALKRSVFKVCHLMCNKLMFSWEVLDTFLTVEGSLSSMFAHMILKAGLSVECCVTQNAGIQTFSSVKKCVLLQMGYNLGTDEVCIHCGLAPGFFKPLSWWSSFHIKCSDTASHLCGFDHDTTRHFSLWSLTL